MMSWIYPIAFVLLISETSCFAPTVQVQHDVHEWFTESLHEAEVGDIKVSSVDDSWIGHEFHSVSPASFYFGQSRHEIESPPAAAAGGNEWMTHTMQWGGVASPTAAQALAPGVVGLPRAGRSDGFVDETTTHKVGTNVVGLTTGRADLFGTTTSIMSMSPTSTSTTTTTTQADHDIQSLSRASVATRQGSADWFHQALQLVDR